MPSGITLYELVDALQERKLLTEGELHTELTSQGEIHRATVGSPRGRPAVEDHHRINITIDLKQILGLSIGNRTTPKDEAA